MTAVDTAPIAGERHLHYFNRVTQYSIRPARSAGPHDPYRPGLHHLCFDVEDMDVALATAAADGVEIAQRGSMMGGEMRFAYLDGAHVGVPYIELAALGAGMKAFYDSLPR